MAEYNRFVSYLYAYENNRKTMNNGFVRVETRNTVSSVYVNMKELYGSAAAYRVYMFQRTDSALSGIFLGNVEGRQGGGEFFCKITKDNINNSGISLTEIAGIIILGENGRKYGTCWDDEPLDAEAFAAAAVGGEKLIHAHIQKDEIVDEVGNNQDFELILEQKVDSESNFDVISEQKVEERPNFEVVSERKAKAKQDLNPMSVAKASVRQETEPVSVMRSEHTSEEQPLDEKNLNPQSEKNSEKISTKESGEDRKTISTKERQEDWETISTKDLMEDRKIISTKERQEDWETISAKELMAESIALSAEDTEQAAGFFCEPLLAGIPGSDEWDKNPVKNKRQAIRKRLEKLLNGGIKMYPFEDSEVENCIRLEIQDIGMLPMKYWFYAGNSFVLQSYYAYRHLILAKRIDGSYILGVPGLGEAKDSFMARRFGFNCFKAIREKSDDIPASNFGYWYVKLI